MKLNRNFFVPSFNNHTFKPITDAIVFQVMIAQHFYMIPNLKFLGIVGWRRKWNR
jgi:hypothetical protein